MPGAVILLGTPIGNLGDASPRLIETLRGLDLLYCEDTRVTGKLLQLLGVKVPLRSLSDDSREAEWDNAIEQAQDGKRIGFASDAGMPGVSDPARRLTRAAWLAGLAPEVIPGPSALSTLLTACPFVDNRFCFLGFAPRKPGERESFVAELKGSLLPCFFFESPLRAHGMIDLISNSVEPQRQLLIGREMTKLHEQYVLFSASEWPDWRERIPAKGEFSLAVAAAPPKTEAVDSSSAKEALSRLEAAGFTRKDAAKALSAVWDVAANEIKKLTYGN